MFATNFEIKFKGAFKKQKQIQKIYENWDILLRTPFTAQEIKLSIKGFFSKCN